MREEKSGGDNTLNIFNIQRYSTHDGNGVRTNIFFKGCPLRCNWCSNPESQSFKESILLDDRTCKGFGECQKAGNGAIKFVNGKPLIDRKRIKNPSLLRDVCPAKALMVSGKNQDIETLLKEIRKDIPFYVESGGGVTLTGGEPFSQGDALKEFSTRLKEENLHISIETSLHVKWERIEPFIKIIDLFLVDLKHVDRVKFNTHTGGDAQLVLDNLSKLNEHEVNLIIRIPVIPGFNNSIEEMESIIDFVTSLSIVTEIHLMPYHKYGIQKYRMLGIAYDFKQSREIQPDDLLAYTAYANKKGLKVIVGG